MYESFDNFHLQSGHAPTRKAREAKLEGAEQMTVWGSGTPLREFLHVDDLADALVFLNHLFSRRSPQYIGTGDEVRIGDLARIAKDAVGTCRADGVRCQPPSRTPRKLVVTTKLNGLG